MTQSRAFIALWLCACAASTFLFSSVAAAEDYHTPLAGEAFHTELFGRPVDVPPRDRRHVTAIDLGLQWIPHGPNELELVPFGSLFVWHNWETQRLRGIFTGIYNDVLYNRGLRWLDGWEAVLTFSNFILPVGRSEYVEGQRIPDVELQWNYVYAGLGIGYRKPLPPGHQDSALEVTLTYEPGYLWFDRSSRTSPAFIVPSDTYQGRAHFRMRTDMLNRNLMELPHRGVAFGGDLLYGHRTHWGQWGGVAFDPPDVERQKTYLAGSAFVVAAGGVPFVHSDRHRLIGSGYGGLGEDLDRFSAFRLPGRPTGFEWEALARPILPGIAFNELFTSKYGIAQLMYRYEALFFLYPYLSGTYALVERPRFADNGRIKNQLDTLNAVSAGIVTGAPWHSQVELNYSYNFGAFRVIDGERKMGGHGIFVLWSKEFR